MERDFQWRLRFSDLLKDGQQSDALRLVQKSSGIAPESSREANFTAHADFVAEFTLDSFCEFASIFEDVSIGVMQISAM